MGKKILISSFVILFGFMLGFIVLRPTSLTKSRPNSASSNTPAANQDITASLSVKPTTIKSAGEEKNISLIDKTVVEISYRGESTGVKNVKIYLYIQGGGRYELNPLSGTSIDQEETKSRRVTVLKGPNAKAGETKKVAIYLLNRDAGEASISADVIVDGKSKRTNTVNLKID